MSAEPRPTATPAQTREAMDLFIATAHLGQQEMAQRLGLNVTDLLSFACVLKAGENLLSAGDLAEHAHVTTGAVTGILNRLERGGYVTRVPDPTDRRRVRVAALPDAVAKVVALYQPYYDRLDAVFAGYSADEIAVLHDWFSRSTNLALAYIEELRAKDADGE
ncbi:MarR family winged helix-turn-helix transcriptional regulator [Streptomyces canus]|uniref:DNA-binding MarR family transcriptional regulator n=1 Tax=Streptomyces canus TaxID=58343 RepID=A0AAW8FJH0_9ACTN|nr:MarR family transcriptional regulator [Streptomyces canus]MDQ0909386.1 DNA-binding MarR family transcriptional regulator [Streptomyces canus]MDQ1069405.1 DNA-binding MarR family transcriptional regulator [Streptomyces canus]